MLLNCGAGLNQSILKESEGWGAWSPVVHGHDFQQQLFMYICTYHAEMLSHVRLATLWTVAHQGPLSMGFLRQEYWSGLPFPPPGNLPKPGVKPASFMCLALVGGLFTTKATREAQHVCMSIHISADTYVPKYLLCRTFVFSQSQFLMVILTYSLHFNCI